MKLNALFFVLFGSLLLLGCAERENASFGALADSAPPAPPEAATVGVERKLIKEGSVSFETNDLPNTREQIFGSVEKYKGYVSSDQEYRSNGRTSNTIVVRVPAHNFDQLLSEATKGVASFDSKNIEVKDVTEDFVDVQARLKTKKELEIRYLDILRKATKVTELLEVEKELGQVRSEIESIEGRLNYLQNQVSLATLTFSFYKTTPDQTPFGSTFSNGFKNGWDNLIWFLVGLINFWPFIILISGAVSWIIWRKRRKAQAGPKEQEQ